jgi:uncharacterized membrane protein YjgN (DUF898 family)
MTMSETAPPLPANAEALSFSYVERKGLLKLSIINFLLGIVTLGFYRFWAKTNVRRHIWSCVHINGEPLEYTGTGMELFKGFLVVMAVFVLPYAVFSGIVSVVYGPESPLLVMAYMLLLIAIYVLWGFAVYKARKYQLSRTNWRGIRGTLVGSAMTYSLLYFGSQIAKSMTLGWATPVMNTVLQEQITNDMRFGDAAFKFKGRAGPLYPTYAMCWLLTLAAIIFVAVMAATTASLPDFLGELTSGNANEMDSEEAFFYIALAIAGLLLVLLLLIPMLWAIYIAKELRTFATYTRFDGAPFQLAATTGSVIWLTIINLLILIFTLGIGWPYIQQRLVRFIMDRLSLEGKVDIDRIAQSTAKLETRGEGLADAFDVGGL